MEVRQVVVIGVERVLKRGQKGAKKGSKTIEKCTPQRLYRGAVGGRFFLSPRANPRLIHKFLRKLQNI